jgi:hypothetical protein
VGGLAGVQYGNISNCFCIGTVSGNLGSSGGEAGGSKVGGLVGYQAGGSTTSCFSVGEVVGYGDIGGLTGHVANGTISKSYSNSHIFAFALGGGLVGYNKGNIINCYALGNIDTLGGCVGGLVGTQELGGIQDSFASVIINEYIPTAGGLVGRLVGGSIQFSFFDSTIMSGKKTVADYVNGEILSSSGKSTEEMMRRNSYTSWIFNADNWGMYADGNGYPYLASIHNYTLVTPTGGGSKVYDGVQVTPALSYTCSDYYDESKPFTGSISFPSIKDAGESKPSIGTLNSPNYQIRFNNSVKYTIFKATPTITVSATPASPQVQGTDIMIRATLRGVNGGESPKGTLKIMNGTDTIATFTVNSFYTTVSQNWDISYQNFGMNNITAVYSGDNNYNAVTSEVIPYQIKGATTLNFQNQTVEYTGSPIDMTGKALATGSTGAITYRFYKDYLCTEPISAPVDAGTYYCKVTVAPDENFNGATTVATVTITPKAITDSKVTLTGFNSTYFFTGEPISPVPTVVSDTGVTLINGVDYDLSYSGNTAIGINTATVIITFKGNYSGTVSKTFSIAYAPADSSLYSISGGIDSWTNQDIVITGVGGNTLCLTPTGTFANSLTITAESASASGTSLTFYVKDSSGAIHENVITYKLDKTKPTGKVTLGTNVWNSFLNTITFGLFFKETKTVTITADSDLSGTTVAYYKSVTPIAEADIASISGWVTGTSFDINPNEKCYVYVRLTDGAGNVSYLNSDGIVVYTDSEQDTKSISFTKTSKTDVTAQVTLNGNTIKQITYNGSTLTQGVDYTVNGNTITFAASYLDTFAASATPYTFIISYNPLGEMYVDAVGNQAPNTTSIELTVSKADVTPVVVVVPSSQSRPNKVTLSVIGLENVTGTIQFFANGTELATKPVGSTVEFTAQGSVDTYDFTVVYSGDENYNGATSAATQFTFSKGNQNALSINPVETKTYGDADFTLSTTGGSGTGAITYTVTSGTDVISISGTGAFAWSITNEKNTSNASVPAGSIATIDPNTGVVTTKAAGSFTVQVKRSGDGNYNDSATATMDITIEKRTLTVTASSDQSKYLGTADPVFTYSYSGNVSGETPAFTGALTRDAGEDIGTSYAIKSGNLALVDNESFKADNYTISFTGASFTIKYLTGTENAVLDTPNGDNGWFRSNVTINLTAPSGFQISPDAKNWSDSVTLDNTDGTDKTAEYYLKRISDGAQTDKLTSASYKVDNTAPTGKITLGMNEWNNFLNTITFGLFFKDTQTVVITTDTDLSGVVSIAYYKSATSIDSNAIQSITNWVAYDSEVSVTPEDAESFVYYAKITDNAGNVTYLSTDGATFDLTASVINGVVNGATYYTSQVVTVTEANLASLTVNGESFTSGGILPGDRNATYVIVATDKAGNTTTVTVYMKPINSLASTIDGLTTSNVAKKHASLVTEVKQAISAVDTKNATVDEKAKLKAIIDTCDALLAKINEPESSAPDTSSNSQPSSSAPESVSSSQPENSLPDTRDSSQPTSILIVMAVSALLLSISLIKRRRRSIF